MKIKIKKFQELTGTELYKILKIRAEVFVVEQECAFNDVDGKDYQCTHIFMEDENEEVVAYIRAFPPGISYENSSLGRVLVKKEYREKGLARQIVQEGINYLFNSENRKEITIGAQHYLENFYKSLGFKKISEVYLDDGIPHVDMTLKFGRK